MRTKTTDQPWMPDQSVVSRTGQITLPAAILRHLGWQPGSTRICLVSCRGRLELRRLPRSLVAQTAGSLAQVVRTERHRTKDHPGNERYGT